MTHQLITREKIGVTQQAFADFLNLSLTQLAMSEIKQRSLPTSALLTISQIEICLLQSQTDMAVANADNDKNPLEKRYKTCLLQITSAKRILEKLQHQYQLCTNAIIIAKNLPAKLPQATTAQLQWLEILGNDAIKKLTRCSKAQQQLIQIKITTLQAEAAELLPLI